jgi:ribose transport system substrate-binding protein
MKSQQRQEQIISRLFDQGSVRIAELCERFQVSEGTIRNDLRTMEEQGRLIRTHGGAVAIGVVVGGMGVGRRQAPLLKRLKGANGNGANGATPLAGDLRHVEQIQSIAQRAVELIDEGDSILLSSSPITQAMAHGLLAMKSLTVLTNSLDIAHTLSHNPSHTVILIGGQVRLNRDSLDGRAAVGMLERMRVNKAFIACDGVSAAQGFASNDIADAQVKASMVSCADNIITLAMSEAVGKLALMSFAGLNQAHHLITANDVAQDPLRTLMAAGVRVSLCGDHITEVCADCPPDRKWRIGFANLTEAQDFAVSVRQSVERAALESGNIELILTDNAADPQLALENARRMLDAKVDLIVEYQQDERTNYILMDLFRTEGIPVIAVDIPMPGAVYFGADNYRAGRIAGEAAVNWIRQRWGGKLDKVVCLEQSESGSIPAARIQGALVTLRASFPLKDIDIIYYDTRGTLEESRSAAMQALRNIPWGRHVLFVGINANSAIGALEAADVLSRQSCTAVVSQNASNRIRRELQVRNPMLIGAVDYFPENYGQRVIQLALSMLSGKSPPPATYTDHMLITAENVQRVYPSNASDQVPSRDLVAPTL